MKMDVPSRTALAVATLRAAHRLFDPPPWIGDDELSVALYGNAARQVEEQLPGWAANERIRALRAHVLMRDAVAEQRLSAAALRGVRQCVMLGAGYDTFAFRQPPWARELTFFEVDAAATQADKRARLERAGVAVPDNVRFATIDFERQTLADVLAASGFDVHAPAFVSWLGVTMYLSRDAVLAVLALVASFAAGSEVLFTYTTPGDDDAELARRLQDAGEPLVTSFERGDLEASLRRMGYGALETVTEQGAPRYLGARTDGLWPLPNQSIVSATVGGETHEEQL